MENLMKKSRFHHWGAGIGVLSLFLALTYFLMFFGMALSFVGLIFSVINFIVGIKTGNTNERNFAVLGFLINLLLVISTIRFFMHPVSLG